MGAQLQLDHPWFLEQPNPFLLGHIIGLESLPAIVLTESEKGPTALMKTFAYASNSSPGVL